MSTEVFTVSERVMMDDNGDIETVLVAEAPALDTPSNAPPTKRLRVSAQFNDKLPLHLSTIVAAYAQHNPLAGNFLLLNDRSCYLTDELRHNYGQAIIARNNGAHVTAATAFVATLLKKPLALDDDDEFYLKQAYESKSPLFVAVTSLAEWTDSTWYAPTAREAIAGAVQVAGTYAESNLEVWLYKPVRQQPLTPTTPKLKTQKEDADVYELHIGGVCCNFIYEHLTKDTTLEMMRTPWFRAQVERYDALRQLLFGRHKAVTCGHSNGFPFSGKELLTLEFPEERVKDLLLPMIEELDMPLPVTRHL
jgi:hypothetical protein